MKPRLANALWVASCLPEWRRFLHAAENVQETQAGLLSCYMAQNKTTEYGERYHFNGINSPQRFYKHEEFIRECFRKLGPHIASCHAKDLDWPAELQVHFTEVIPGRGQISYRPVLEELSKLTTDAPLMLEHLKTAEEYEEAKRHILKVGAETGVTFA